MNHTNLLKPQINTIYIKNNLYLEKRLNKLKKHKERALIKISIQKLFKKHIKKVLIKNIKKKEKKKETSHVLSFK